jgi:TolB-like protein
LANGVLEAITQHLSMIEGLRVMPRTSVEQYRENKKSAKEIGEELDVSYLIGGSFFMIEDQVKLTIQLVVAEEEDHVFYKEYDRNYKDIFAVQSEVAQTIAKEIEVAITPEEKQRIEKVPTTNLTALDFYLRGREEYLKFQLDNNNRKALERAEDQYYKALEYDSTFARANTGLAYVYWDKHYWESYFSENFLDSVLILADKALSFNPQLSDAYTVRGDYYRANDRNEQSISEYDKAIKLNPNDWMAYYWRGYTYRWNLFDLVKAIEDFHKAASLYRGPFLPSILKELSRAYLQAGFPEKCRSYAHQALMLDGDSISYYYDIFRIGYYFGKGYEKSLEKIYLMDTTINIILQQLGEQYGYEGKFEESLIYLKKYYKRLEAFGNYSVSSMHRLGYAYWMNGFYAEADYYFDTMIEYYNDLNKVGRLMDPAKYDLACIYAFRGENEKAYENLKFFDQLERIPLWWIDLLRIDPFFDSIRDEPEFQQILKDTEAKYQAEHERIRKWLEENDML